MLGTILGVIWLIIKIILWILLGLIGLVIVVLLLVLLVPIRYDVEAEKYKEIHAKVKVTYLLRLVRVFFHYSPQGYYYKVKVLFFTILSEDTRARVSESQEAETETPLTQGGEEASPLVEESEDLSPEDDLVGQEEVLLVALPENEPTGDVPQDQSEAETSVNVSDHTVKDEGSKADKKIKKKKQKKEKKPKEGESGLDTAKRFLSFLREEENHGVLKFVLGRIFRAIGSVLPRKFEGDIHFGTDDPATTAYIFGGASIFYPKYKDSLNLTPNFETPIIEGRVKVVGKIILGVFVWMAIRIYLDSRVRRLIKEVRRTL